jgi:hypothetical protein
LAEKAGHFISMLTGKVKNRTLHKNREGCGTQSRTTDNRDGHPPSLGRGTEIRRC